MTTVNIYLTFDGNCMEAFEFYQSIFGGDFAYVGRFGEMPKMEGMPEFSEEEKKRIMHMSLPIGGDTVLMGSDTAGPWAAEHKQGNNFSVSVSTDKKNEADRLFNELSNGGKVTMPMEDTFWGDYFGSLTDKFGINWMIGFNDGSQG